MSEVGSALLAVRDVCKQFGATAALTNVDLAVAAGARHAIVGENGSGKTTLMRIIAGLVVADAGTVVVDGVPIGTGPSAAQHAGIALVHQELSLVPTLSVAENITLGDQPGRYGFISFAARRAVAMRALKGLEVDLPPDVVVSRLSIAQRQLVEVAKALRFGSRILILDEPTSSLTPAETNDLLALLRRLAGDGTAILFISHRISEVTALCDRVTVLRDGRKVADRSIADTSPAELVRLMVGRELLELDQATSARSIAEPVLEVDDIRAGRVHDVSFRVHRGEILGVGGLIGAGRTEVARAVVGLDSLEAGTVQLHVGGATLPVRNFGEALRHGVGYVPEDRRAEGVAVGLSIEDNVALPSLREVSPRFLLSRRRIAERARQVIDRLMVRTQGQRQLVGRLSGGNQQKVVLGKWLVRNPSLLVLDEPTRGVDVGSKADIHREIREVAAAGAGVLLVSSDLPELLALSDRIMVMRDGRVVGEVDRREATEERVMALAAGVGSAVGVSGGIGG